MNVEKYPEKSNSYFLISVVSKMVAERQVQVIQDDPQEILYDTGSKISLKGTRIFCGLTQFGLPNRIIINL